MIGKILLRTCWELPLYPSPHLCQLLLWGNGCAGFFLFMFCISQKCHWQADQTLTTSREAGKIYFQVPIPAYNTEKIDEVKILPRFQWPFLNSVHYHFTCGFFKQHRKVSRFWVDFPSPLLLLLSCCRRGFWGVFKRACSSGAVAGLSERCTWTLSAILSAAPNTQEFR